MTIFCFYYLIIQRKVYLNSVNTLHFPCKILIDSHTEN